MTRNKSEIINYYIDSAIWTLGRLKIRYNAPVQNEQAKDSTQFWLKKFLERALAIGMDLK